MLKKLDLTNFQSHKRSSLEFHSGLNVVSGSSGSGKSTIVRALVLALKGRPSGGSYKTWSAKDNDPVEVSLEFDNGKFTRKRVGSKNSYETGKHSFEAIKSDVPEPIQTLANMTSYNLQSQFDGYFLLQDTPGEVAKQLNELAGLSTIDQVTKKLNGSASSLKQEINKMETTVANLKAQIDELKFIEELDVILTNLYSDIDAHSKAAHKSNLLDSSIQSIKELNNKIGIANHFLKIEKPYIKTKEKLEGLIALQKTKDTLSDIVNNLIKTENLLQEEKEWLTVEKPYRYLVSKLPELAELKTRHNKLIAEMDNLEDLESRIEEKQWSLDKKYATYGELLTKSSLCPMCQSAITEQLVESVIKNMRG